MCGEKLRIQSLQDSFGELKMRNVLWRLKRVATTLFFAVLAWCAQVGLLQLLGGSVSFYIEGVTSTNFLLILSSLIIGVLVTTLLYIHWLHQQALGFLGSIKSDWVLETLKHKAVLWNSSIISLREAKHTLEEGTTESSEGTILPKDMLTTLDFIEATVALKKRLFWESHAVAKSAGIKVYPTFKEHLNWEPQKPEQAE